MHSSKTCICLLLEREYVKLIKLWAGNSTGKRQNIWNLKLWALGQHSHPARLRLFTTSALSCSLPHGDTQGWDFSGWKQPARQPLGMIPRHITSYRHTAQTLHLNFLKGWKKSMRLWMRAPARELGVTQKSHSDWATTASPKNKQQICRI